FPAESEQRYVPPEEDMIQVLQQAEGQDLVMLMVFYYTGARSGEVFRLQWSDVDFPGNKICLRDKKTGGKGWRTRWLPMHTELAKALEWWKKARPCLVDHVFFQVQCHEKLGDPFTHRSHYMPAVCKRLGIKRFTFHGIRHKSAEVTFLANGLNDAQILLGHSRPTTTDIYVRSAGLYASRDGIAAALANSAIGQAANSLFAEMEIPHESQPHEGFCNTEHVTQMLQ
ncbi:MAG: site-specific integrase, partial [Desulfovibrio sp.]|nr:site-specific integrase [Desulfovibrio sp.]